MVAMRAATVHCDNPEHPAFRPARHRDCWGRLRRPVGTLREMLRRAQWGDPPEPWGADARARLLVTLAHDAELRDALRSLIGGA